MAQILVSYKPKKKSFQVTRPAVGQAEGKVTEPGVDVVSVHFVCSLKFSPGAHRM